MGCELGMFALSEGITSCLISPKIKRGALLFRSSKQAPTWIERNHSREWGELQGLLYCQKPSMARVDTICLSYAVIWQGLMVLRGLSLRHASIIRRWC